MIPPVESRGKVSQVVTVTITPDGGVAPIKATGRYVYVISGPASGLKLRLQDEAFVDATSGMSLECEPGAYFEWIEVENNSSVAATVKIYIGFARYEDRSPGDAPPEPLTDLSAHAHEGPVPDVIAAEGVVAIAPRTDSNVVRRKALIVSNLHATQELYLMDNGAGEGDVALPFPACVIWPRSTAIFHVAGTVKLSNPSLTESVEYLYGEIYYVREPFPI